MEIRPVGTDLFHADGKTEMARLKVAVRNFMKASKNTQKCVLTRTPVMITQISFMWQYLRMHNHNPPAMISPQRQSNTTERNAEADTALST